MAVLNDTIAPEFELSNQFGETIRLSDFRGRMPVAVVFFPLAFTGTCTSELCELRDNLALFETEGIELIGISVDSKATLRAWAESEGFQFTLLADFWPHGAVASAYDVFLPEKGFANRATFLIDRDGVIRASFVTEPGQARPLASYREAIASLRQEEGA